MLPTSWCYYEEIELYRVFHLNSHFMFYVGVVVEWLKRRARDQQNLGSNPTRAILLCPWERYFAAHSPAWWFWQAVLNYSQISIRLQADSNILASPEAGLSNCLPRY